MLGFWFMLIVVSCSYRSEGMTKAAEKGRKQPKKDGTSRLNLLGILAHVRMFCFHGHVPRIVPSHCGGRTAMIRERNVLFNDALNTFYQRLYGVRHMVKGHSDSEKGNPLPPHGLLFPINSKGSFICTIPQTG